MSKGNSKDFSSVIGNGFTERDIKYYSSLSSETILTRRYYDGKFITDYRRPIECYLKACGCKIIGTNNNWWDDHFYVYFTIPTKAVDSVVWFDEVYEDGIYWSNNKKAMVKLLLGVSLFIIFILLIQLQRLS